MAIAGKVSIVPRGEWQSTEVYTRLDLVTFNRNAYLSLKESTGIQPTNTEYWMLLIENVSNTEIEELQTQIDDIVEDIADIIDGTTPVAKSTHSETSDNATTSTKSNDSDLLQGFTAKQVGESGVRNLLPYPYSFTTQEINGLLFVDNGDGSITVNGTATAGTMFHCKVYNRLPLMLGLEKGRQYTLSGCPKGGSLDTYSMNIAFRNADDVAISPRIYDFGNGLTFSIDKYVDNGAVKLQVIISVYEGMTMDNVTFYPMLELGSTAHDFVPYHFGGAEDSQKLNGLIAEEFVSNENLLVNPNFKDPVNSSGKTEWTGVTETIDGWKTNNVNDIVELKEFGLAITLRATSFFRQTVNLKAGTYTMSIDLYSDDEHINGSLTAMYPGNNWFISLGNKTGVISKTFTLSQDTTDMVGLFGNTTGTVYIKSIKIERGSVATPFIPPNKEVEKLKCGATVGDSDTLDGYHADNLPYVPLDGGTLTGKQLKFFNGYAELYGNENLMRMVVSEEPDNNTDISDRTIILYNRAYKQNIRDAIGFHETFDGVSSYYSVLHTGNSKPTHISNTAPTDTSALWYDTTNKVCKYYKDGAWQQ